MAVNGIIVAKAVSDLTNWWGYTEDVLAPGTDGQVVVVDSTQPSGFNVADQVVVPSFSDAEAPTDSGDHQHFTLAHSPSPAASLILVVNRAVFAQGVSADYTLSGASITLASALSGTFTILAWYRY